MCPANHISSRSLLRSSSTREPSDPPHRVVFVFVMSAVAGHDYTQVKQRDFEIKLSSHVRLVRALFTTS